MSQNIYQIKKLMEFDPDFLKFLIWKSQFFKNSIFVLHQVWKIAAVVYNIAGFHSQTEAFKIHSTFNPTS